METQTRLSRHKNLFRRRILLVYSPSRQMTLLHALSCRRVTNVELQFVFRRENKVIKKIKLKIRK